MGFSSGLVALFTHGEITLVPPVCQHPTAVPLVLPKLNASFVTLSLNWHMTAFASLGNTSEIPTAGCRTSAQMRENSVMHLLPLFCNTHTQKKKSALLHFVIKRRAGEHSYVISSHHLLS